MLAQLAMIFQCLILGFNIFLELLMIVLGFRIIGKFAPNFFGFFVWLVGKLRSWLHRQNKPLTKEM